MPFFFNCIFSLFFMWRLITWLFDILLYWYLLWFHCRQIQEMPLELQVLESRQCQGMPVYLGKWSKFSLWGSETLLCTLICRYDCLSCLHLILNNDMENSGFRRISFFLQENLKSGCYMLSVCQGVPLGSFVMFFILEFALTQLSLPCRWAMSSLTLKGKPSEQAPVASANSITPLTSTTSSTSSGMHLETEYCCLKRSVYCKMHV